jgi:hypothetical protein
MIFGCPISKRGLSAEPAAGAAPDRRCRTIQIATMKSRCSRDRRQSLWFHVLDVDTRHCLFGPRLLEMAQRLGSMFLNSGGVLIERVTLGDARPLALPLEFCKLTLLTRSQRAGSPSWPLPVLRLWRSVGGFAAAGLPSAASMALRNFSSSCAP